MPGFLNELLEHREDEIRAEEDPPFEIAMSGNSSLNTRQSIRPVKVANDY